MPTENEVYQQLTTIFRDTFMRDDLQIGPETSARDVAGWDSLHQIMIIVAVEQQFGIKLTTREIDNLKNVGDLVRNVMAKAG